MTADQQMNLLERLKAGDSEAFDEVYTSYRKWLWIAALGILQNEADAEEVVQEFFIEFWQRMEQRQFDDIQHLKNYLFISVRNRCLNKLQRDKVARKRNEQMLQHTELSVSYNQLENSELQQQLREAIAKLPPIRSKVFKLGYLFNYTRRQIAAMLNVSEETVKKHMILALKDLRLALKNRDE
ncbi:RNA polymerase sigma-70 factor [Chitinophaga sp. 22620]|jgi:RNA polymerase sigma-70 factor, ECF subfamily|uniref:RNA polymerase sigma-70 factor n=1 Tax=Chitinophaga sp. 22620 TaxID=3453952 RepID=UPI003F86856B